MTEQVLAAVDQLDSAAPGWSAHLHMRFAQRSGKTRMVDRTRQGPLAVQRPFYPEGDVCHTYLLHPPGGVVGGDSLNIQVNMEAGAKALITTPGATKFYRAGGTRLARQVQTLRIAAGSWLEFMPQENIFFPSANAEVETHVEIASGGGFIGWEMQCLGRPVINEAFDQGRLVSKTTLHIDGKLILMDQLRTDATSLVEASAGMRGHVMQAGLYLVAPDPALNEQLTEVTREVLAESEIVAGVTEVDGVVVLRLLGSRTEHLMRLMTRVWARVRPLMFGIEACAPRIWNT